MSIGRIVVDLLAKTGSFDTDINRSAKLAERRAREIDAAFKRAGRAIGLALVAGASAAAVALKSTIDRMDEMSKAAQKVGLPTEDFSKLTYAADLADVSMDTLVGSLGKLTKAQAAALKETSQQAKVFDALGISIKDATGNLRKSGDVMADFADKFKLLEGSPEAMAAGFALFGRSFQQLVPLLKDGGDGIRAAGDELERMGGVLSTEAGQAAEEFNDNLTRLKTAATGLGLQVAQNLLPQLVELTDNMVELARDGERVSEVADRIGAAFALAGRIVGGVSTAFSQLGEFLGATAAAGKGLFDVLSGILSLDYSRIRMGAGLITDGLSGAQDAIANRPRPTTTKKPSVQFITADSGSIAESAFRKSPGELAAEGQAKALQARLNAALGATGGSKTKKTGGKSEAEKEAERLADAYKRLEASLKEQIALHGETTEVAKLRYDLENGELAKLNQGQKDTLLGLAAERDAQIAKDKVTEEGKRLIESLLTPTEELNKLRAEAVAHLDAGRISQEQYNRAVEAYKDPGQQLLEDLQFELELLRLTNAERATAIQLRGMDAEQVRKYGDAIADANKKIEESSKQIALADGIRSEFEDLFVSLVDGSKSAKDALKDFFDNIAAMITRMIASKLVEQLFGAAGTSGTGTQGGDWIAKIFGALFGGGREHGGPVGKGTTYLVGERGPELFVPRSAGTIIPAGPTSRMVGGRSLVQNNNIVVQGRMSRQTAAQADREIGKSARRELARTG